jgi:hypothetical protein
LIELVIGERGATFSRTPPRTVGKGRMTIPCEAPAAGCPALFKVAAAGSSGGTAMWRPQSRTVAQGGP